MLTAQAARRVVERVLQSTDDSEAPGLDCATGPGYVIEEAIRQGIPAEALTGVDFSSAMLRQAQLRFVSHGVTWLEADIQQTFPSAAVGCQGRFAWCACNFGVLHLARPEAFFAVARQVLRPGGLFLFTVWADLAKSPAFQIPLRAIEEHGSSDVGLPPGPPFFKFSDPELASEALTAAGFEHINTEIIDMEWPLNKPEDLWEVFCEGTARTGGMLARQEPEAKARIEAAMREAVVAAQAPGQPVPPYVLSQPCLLVTATVPLAASL